MRISSLLALAGVVFAATAANANIVLFQDYEGGGVVTANSGYVFQYAGYSGSTASKLDTVNAPYSNVTPETARVITNEQSVSAPNSARFAFKFLDQSLTNNWVRLTSFGANPVIDLNESIAFSALILPVDTVAPLAPLGIGIGIREVTRPAGTPLGSNGGSSGSIEWSGVTDNVGGAPNPTRWLQPGVWTDFVFNPSLEPALGFTGNGIPTTASGLAVWEHIVLRAPSVAGATGPGAGYYLYLDNIRAGGRNEIPEPATLSLLGLGLLPLIRRKR